MAKSSLRKQPTRSISLPSRLQHPNANKIEKELNRLKTLEVSSLSTEKSLENSLVSLAQLYNSVQELLQSSTTQKGIVQHQNGIILEEALEESIELLDSCGNIKNLFNMIKEHVQDLQSAMRRKSGCSSIEGDIASYISFRKKLKTDIAKNLKALKHMENKTGQLLYLDLDHHLYMVIRVLTEVTSFTISLFRSALLFLSWPDTKTKFNGWYFVSKLMSIKSVDADKVHAVRSAGCLDIIALTKLQQQFCGKNDAKGAMQEAQRKLQMFDDIITNLDNPLECLFRQLVQYRVTLLNIITQ
ncbi:hypothetical protein LIER_02831 [Lithospermum erythrorhizon]|uniref:Uncharacterized protein n=1 Tax=Lithospermum erythrorhizon TaxID=34254 RepID=A0AAV3NQW2_LITER